MYDNLKVLYELDSAAKFKFYNKLITRTYKDYNGYNLLVFNINTSTQIFTINYIKFYPLLEPIFKRDIKLNFSVKSYALDIAKIYDKYISLAVLINTNQELILIKEDILSIRNSIDYYLSPLTITNQINEYTEVVYIKAVGAWIFIQINNPNTIFTYLNNKIADSTNTNGNIFSSLKLPEDLLSNMLKIKTLDLFIKEIDIFGSIDIYYMYYKYDNSNSQSTVVISKIELDSTYNQCFTFTNNINQPYYNNNMVQCVIECPLNKTYSINSNKCEICSTTTKNENNVCTTQCTNNDPNRYGYCESSIINNYDIRHSYNTMLSFRQLCPLPDCSNVNEIRLRPESDTCYLCDISDNFVLSLSNKCLSTITNSYNIIDENNVVCKHDGINYTFYSLLINPHGCSDKCSVIDKNASINLHTNSCMCNDNMKLIIQDSEFNTCSNSCPPNRAIVNYGSYTICEKCNSNEYYYNNNCILNCPDGTFSNSQNVCTSINCEDNKYFYSDTCLTRCPDTPLTGKINSTNIKYCEDCLYYKSAEHDTCVSDCGKYLGDTNNNKICNYCYINTLDNLDTYINIRASNNQCTSLGCSDNELPFRKLSNDNSELIFEYCSIIEDCLNMLQYYENYTCVDNCTLPNYIFLATSICKECNTELYYILDNLYCVESCNENYTSVDHNGKTCTSCSNYIQNNICVDSCSINYTLIDNKCICNTIDNDYYIYDNECKTSCPLGTTINFNDKTCNDCSQYIENNNCVANCSTKRTPDINDYCVCDINSNYLSIIIESMEYCESVCPFFSELDANNNSCNICNDYVENNSCVANCSVNYINYIVNIVYNSHTIISNICDCDLSHHKYNNTCVSECPVNYTSRLVSNIYDYNECNECNMYIYNNECIEQCPEETTTNDSNSIYCLECINTDNSKYIYEGNCVETCPYEYEPKEVSGKQNYCTIIVNELTCEPNYCMNNGECTVDQTNNVLLCICNEEYKGEKCEILIENNNINNVETTNSSSNQLENNSNDTENINNTDETTISESEESFVSNNTSNTNSITNESTAEINSNIEKTPIETDINYIKNKDYEKINMSLDEIKEISKLITSSSIESNNNNIDINLFLNYTKYKLNEVLSNNHEITEELFALIDASLALNSTTK